jgi:high affinity Mn2+ porin
VGLNADQQVSNTIGLFLRAGWNDGLTSTWAFTEIDNTGSLGCTIKGNAWKRPDDVIGIAGVSNGISPQHQDYLNAGGYGFLIGDGKLTNYGRENITEVYYDAQITNSFWLTLDYQFVMNPAYNEDRGPVNLFALRGHIEF